MFLRGLREGGVPIKFSSWHTYSFSSSAASQVSLQIQERSRSVKALFALQKRFISDFEYDNGATFFDTSQTGASTLQQYQYRIGGRYFPAAPVECSPNGGKIGNGGGEAYIELQKALNIVGDYRLSATSSAKNWAIQPTTSGDLNEFDYTFALLGFLDASGSPSLGGGFESDAGAAASNSSCGGMPSGCFGMGINLETSNGLEISGLNAEEQSDIAFLARWTLPQLTGKSNTASEMLVFAYYDAMIVLRENNVLELIQ